MSRRSILLSVGSLGIGLLAIFLFGSGFEANAGALQGAGSFAPGVSSAGAISVPRNYRKDFMFIGGWSIAGSGERKGAQSIHRVFTQPEAVASFRRTGKFPDGAVLVKELLKTDSARLTTGFASWGSDITGWFVMVKDTRGRFSSNPLWGNGWGWAYFEGDSPQKTVSTNFRGDCLACHIPAQKDDWIFLRGYPALKSE